MATVVVTAAPTCTCFPRERLSTSMLQWWCCTTQRSSSRDTTWATTMTSNGEKTGGWWEQPLKFSNLYRDCAISCIMFAFLIYSKSCKQILFDQKLCLTNILWYRWFCLNRWLTWWYGFSCRKTNITIITTPFKWIKTRKETSLNSKNEAKMSKSPPKMKLKWKENVKKQNSIWPHTWDEERNAELLRSCFCFCVTRHRQLLCLPSVKFVLYLMSTSWHPVSGDTGM